MTLIGPQALKSIFGGYGIGAPEGFRTSSAVKPGFLRISFRPARYRGHLRPTAGPPPVTGEQCGSLRIVLL